MALVVDTGNPPGITITKVERDENGILTARVTVRGDTVPVVYRSGVWGTQRDERGGWRALLPEIAGQLQKRARKT